MTGMHNIRPSENISTLALEYVKKKILARHEI